VVQDDLLERRLAADQRLDRVIAQRRNERADAARHLGAERVPAGAEDMDAGQVGQLRRGPGERDLDGLGAEVAQLAQAALLDHTAVAQDADPIAHRLDLAEDVRGEEDRLAALLGLAHRLAERDLHQRIQSAGRLVEDQQIGTAGERADQLDLLAIALRQRAHLLVGVELEALDERVAVGGVRAPAQLREVRERLGARQRRPQERLAGHVGDAVVGFDRIAPCVDAQQLGAAGARPVQPEQEPDRRRLAGPVRSQISIDLARLDGQVERVERKRVAVALREAFCPDRARHPSHDSAPRAAARSLGGEHARGDRSARRRYTRRRAASRDARVL
jgi:hypothetical protein